MTRVDFHFNMPDKLTYACRLARKVYLAGQQLLVYCADATLLKQFDEALWTFSQLDFVPHVWFNDPLAQETPIVLISDALSRTEDSATVAMPFHTNLMNLGLTSPPFFSRFERLLELVSMEEQDRLAGRERYKFYRERGYPMFTHDLAQAA
jgi:DNA polymerase-3 subunit chi